MQRKDEIEREIVSCSEYVSSTVADQAGYIESCSHNGQYVHLETLTQCLAYGDTAQRQWLNITI